MSSKLIPAYGCIDFSIYFRRAESLGRLIGLDLSRRPPTSAGQAPLAALRGSLGLAYVQLSCVTNVGLVCVVDLTVY